LVKLIVDPAKKPKIAKETERRSVHTMPFLLSSSYTFQNFGKLYHLTGFTINLHTSLKTLLAFALKSVCCDGDDLGTVLGRNLRIT